jgi:hypothetical protein
MDSSGLGQGPVASCCEEGNDTLEFIKGRRILTGTCWRRLKKTLLHEMLVYVAVVCFLEDWIQPVSRVKSHGNASEI